MGDQGITVDLKDEYDLEGEDEEGLRVEGDPKGMGNLVILSTLIRFVILRAMFILRCRMMSRA